MTRKSNHMKKDNPYKVPENYFENLGAQVKEKIKVEELKLNEAEEKQPLIVQLRPYMWMAASVFVLVFAARLILSNFIDPEFKIASFGSDEVQVNTVEIETSTDEEDALFIEEFPDVTDEDIIEYLSDSDIDTDILLANL